MLTHICFILLVVGLFVVVGWLVACLVVWLVGLLVVWFGWLVGLLVWFLLVDWFGWFGLVWFWLVDLFNWFGWLFVSWNIEKSLTFCLLFVLLFICLEFYMPELDVNLGSWDGLKLLCERHRKHVFLSVSASACDLARLISQLHSFVFLLWANHSSVSESEAPFATMCSCWCSEETNVFSIKKDMLVVKYWWVRVYSDVR